MIHEFRAVASDEVGPTDRVCTEPLLARGQSAIDRTFHTRFEMLPHGDVKCLLCGERFFATREGYEQQETKTVLPDG